MQHGLCDYICIYHICHTTYSMYTLYMYHMKPFLYKFIHNIGLRVRQNKPVEAFKKGCVNLALPFFGFP